MKQAGAQITIIDVHAESTSEKIALAHYLDGELGALVGTHTHVQTNDAKIFPGSMAYITDLGMTGPHDGIIGVNKEGPIAAFLTGRNVSFKPSKGEPTLEGALIDFDDEYKAVAIRCFKEEVPVEELEGN
jgi:calcineurin-like phosphoesterase